MFFFVSVDNTKEFNIACQIKNGSKRASLYCFSLALWKSPLVCKLYYFFYLRYFLFVLF